VSNCELCGQQQADGAYLCDPCATTLGQQLAALPLLYRDLAYELVPLGSNWPRGNGGHGTRADAPMPLVEHPLVLRGPGGIVGVLEDWRAALHDDRGWSAPVVPAGIEPRIRAAARALTANLPWIAAGWPQAGQFAQEVRDLYREVTSITAPAERPGLRIGYCPAVYDGVLCGAVLRLPRGTDTIACAWCRAEYPQRLWAWLRNVQDDLVQAS
jgi:LSD1 subclass zinc finger protein